MSLTESFFVWIVSFLLLVLILYIAYKISYKLGIKKALYRTTYIILSVVFAFVLAPFVNNYLFSIDLSELNINLQYKDRTFYTLIDYMEEIIVHNEFLNDLYVYFPSLKDLLMDFPQVLFAPIVYVLLFIVFLIIWFPLYLYLSYKRKRRVLYEKEDNKTHRVWAGVLGCVQAIFIVSILFSSLNGINRIYQNSTSDTLDNKNVSLCDSHDVLKKYKVYCDVLEVYDSTIFATIGGNDSISNHIFDSLTRISYEGGHTSLSKEASLIIKSGIVLSQSGLLDSILNSSETLPMEAITENKLTQEDIDIIIETLNESEYSENILLELGELVENTLNDLTKEMLGQETFGIRYTINKADIINEIKVGLQAIVLLSNGNLLDELIVTIQKIYDFVTEIPENRRDQYVVFEFLVDLAETIDLDELKVLVEYLYDSKMFRSVIPYVLDEIVGPFGFDFVSTQGDILSLLYDGIDFLKIIKIYKPVDALDFFVCLNDYDLRIVARIAKNVVNSPSSSGFLDFVFSAILHGTGINYTVSSLEKIYNWEYEVIVVQELCKVAQKIISNEDFTFNDLKMLLSNRKSKIIDILLSTATNNASRVVELLILYLGG